MDLSAIIEECLSSEQETALSLSFQKAHSQLKDKLHQKKDQKKLSAEDQALSDRLAELKLAETEGRLSWLDYSSWMKLPLKFRNEFIEILDPVIYSAVYFEKDQLISNLSNLKDFLGADLSIGFFAGGSSTRLYVSEC